ncbi:SMEK domain-containing protein [Priestia aryabhattai]
MLTRSKLKDNINLKLNWLCFNLETNAKSNKLDEHVESENFIKDLLNIMCNSNFKNLNQDRSNEPGLDLGEEQKHIGIQVTTKKSKKKVEMTLQKIIDNGHHQRYENFYILVLGTKQKTMTPLDADLTSRLSFDSTEHIVDINDIQNIIGGLDTEKLKMVSNYIDDNIITIYDLIDIGPKSILLNIEELPEYAFNTCDLLFANIEERAGKVLTTEEKVEKSKAIATLYDFLYKQPRKARELFYILVSNSEFAYYSNAYKVDEAGVYRIFNNNPELKKELELLEINHLVTTNYDEEGASQLYTITLQGICRDNDCLYDIQNFIEDKSLDPTEVYIEPNFSYFSS